MSPEIKSRAFALDPTFNYLPEQDRYILALDRPSLKFNIIGVGVNGQEHIHVTYLEGRAAIHGIYDPNPSSVAAAQQLHQKWSRGQELVIYDSLEAACNDPAVDGLIICTPNYTHLEVVKVAAQSGKHILLEKPIATSVPDALSIMEMAEAYTAVFQIGLQYRYKPTYHEAIYEILTRQAIGQVKTISIAEHRIPFLDKVNQWNKFAEYSGDTLIEKCCHYFDLLNLFAGSRPFNVYASGSMAVNFTEFEYNGRSSDILDNAFVIVNYENGIRASFNLCMFAPLFYEELIVCGDDGRLKTYEQVDFLPQSSSHTHLEIMCGDNKPSRRATPNYPALIEQSGHHGATYYEHVNFVNNIQGQPTQTATAREGFWSIVVAAAAQQSIQTGKVVTINDFLAQYDISM
jgi:predicted dehydrogenase